MKIKIVSITEVSKATGIKTPHMIKECHRGIIDSSDLPKITKVYNDEMQEGFEAIIKYINLE